MNPKDIAKRITEDPDIPEDIETRLQKNTEFLKKGYENKLRIDMDNMKSGLANRVRIPMQILRDYVAALNDGTSDENTIPNLVASFNQLADRMRRQLKIEIVPKIERT